MDKRAIEVFLKQRPLGCQATLDVTAQSQVNLMRRDPAYPFTLSVHPVACPAILGGVMDNSGPDRVHLDVAVASEDIAGFLNQAGAEAAFPEGAGTLVCPVDVLHLTLTQDFHQQGSTFLPFGRNKQIHMIGHEAPGLQAAMMLFGLLRKNIQVTGVIALVEKTGSSVVASLDDVPGDVRYHKTRA